jgi:hypothetical protein
MRIGQRWREAEMRKYEFIFARALRSLVGLIKAHTLYMLCLTGVKNIPNLE